MERFGDLLNLPGIEADKVEVKDYEVIIVCSSPLDEQICPKCGMKCRRITKYYLRTIKDLEIFGKNTVLKLTVRQFKCKECHNYFNENFVFVNPKYQMTERYREYIYKCCQGRDINHVALQESLSWHVVSSIFESWVKKKTTRFESVRKLGIDEFSIKKGHGNFACVLVDLEDGTVIDILKERTNVFLKEYFKGRGKDFCEQIEVLSCDMWQGFASLVGTVFPNAQLVIDRFHVFKNLNRLLDNFRKKCKRTLFKGLELHQGKLRFALLKASESLSYEEKKIRDAAFEISMDLKIFYNLREELRDIFNSNLRKKGATTKISEWEKQAENFNNRHLNVFLKTLNNWREGVLNFFNERISNGIVEGKNNKIKMIKRRAFGFLNFEKMRLRILDEC